MKKLAKRIKKSPKKLVSRNPKSKYTKDDLDLANSWVQHYANLITEARAKRQVDKARKYMDKWNDVVIEKDKIKDYLSD